MATSSQPVASLPTSMLASEGSQRFAGAAARSVLRHIRVNSKHELKQRIIEFINDLNRDPVIHRWRYQTDAA